MHGDELPTYDGSDDEQTWTPDDEPTAVPGEPGEPGSITPSSARPAGLSYQPGDTIGRYTIRQSLGEGGDGRGLCRRAVQAD